MMLWSSIIGLMKARVWRRLLEDAPARRKACTAASVRRVQAAIPAGLQLALE